VSSRTKYIHVKHWFFKEHIGDGSDITLLKKIDTEDQISDIFTKGVIEKLFIPLRNKLMG
jgi:SUMO ligase MMS21 Smc5/6 complex component